MSNAMVNLFQYDSKYGRLEIICDLIDESVPEFISQINDLVSNINISNSQKLPLLLITEQVDNMDTIGFATLLAMLKVLSDKFDIKIVASNRIRKFAKLYYLEDFLSSYYLHN